MRTSGIRITRYPYEEPYHLNLRIEASNGRFAGDLEYYCNAKDLGMLGNQLSEFSGNPGTEIRYELGSEDPKVRFAFYLGLEVKLLGSRGNCKVHIRMRNNREDEIEGSEFSIEADVADLNRLGKLLVEFGNLRHHVLEWRIQDGELFE